MMTNTDRHRVTYDHQGNPVTLADVAWGETYADQRAWERRVHEEAAARARGEYVPSLFAGAAAWTITLDLAEQGVRATAYPVREEPIEGRIGAAHVVFRIEGTYDPAAASAAVTVDGAPRETRVVDGVLWVRSVVVDPWAEEAGRGDVSEAPF